MARILARTGLYLGATTVRRMLKKDELLSTVVENLELSVVIDHFSRFMVGFAVFPKRPLAQWTGDHRKVLHQ